MKTKAEFLKELDAVIAETRKQWDDRKAGKDGIGTPLELETILEYLEALKAKSAKPPKKAQRQVECGGIIHMMTDNWGGWDPLEVRMMNLCDFYIDKL